MLDTSTNPLPPDLQELLTITKTLAALIEPLQMILAMERAPGVGDRLDALLAELSAISTHIQRAADTMVAALAAREEERLHRERMEVQLVEMQSEIKALMTWLGVPQPGARRRS